MTSAPLPLVDLRHVNVTLDGHHALKDVSWSLSPGEHWAFVGANGSGKSTLLRVIRGQQWIDPDGGERGHLSHHVVERLLGVEHHADAHCASPSWRSNPASARRGPWPATSGPPYRAARLHACGAAGTNVKAGRESGRIPSCP